MNPASIPSTFAGFSNHFPSTNDGKVDTAIPAVFPLQQDGPRGIPTYKLLEPEYLPYNDYILGTLFSSHSIVGICNLGPNYTQGYPQEL